MFQFLTHVELSGVARSIAAILEMPQYEIVLYQKNVAYAFIKLSAKSHSFIILCIMDAVLSCPTTMPCPELHSVCHYKQSF